SLKSISIIISLRQNKANPKTVLCLILTGKSILHSSVYAVSAVIFGPLWPVALVLCIKLQKRSKHEITKKC
ncbi:MAG: hypothetical protein L3J44_07165, partial [Campylobacteraceae bacterium]|nr:hypothetical protein [Campylobacteraceae bacterium]